MGAGRVHLVIKPPTISQRRRLDVRQRRGGEIGASSTRHDGGDSTRIHAPRRPGPPRLQCWRRRSRREDRRSRSSATPKRWPLQARRTETDIENVVGDAPILPGAIGRTTRSRSPRATEALRHEHIARAEPRRSAAMRENDEPGGRMRQEQVSAEPATADRDFDPLESLPDHANLTLGALGRRGGGAAVDYIWPRRHESNSLNPGERSAPPLQGASRERRLLAPVAMERKHMESAPHIEFQGMEASPEFRDKIAHHLSRLEERFGRITACRVTVKAPSGHRHVGDPYEIKIHLSLPGRARGRRRPHAASRRTFPGFRFRSP